MLLANTHLLGIVSLALAALAAAMRPGTAWRGMALALALMAAMVATDATGIVHNRVEDMLKAKGLYQQHAAVQWTIMKIAAVPVLVAAGLAVWKTAGATRAAMIFVLALAALFVVQAVSLHQVDVVLGHAVGPVMVVSLGWLAGSAGVVVAALASFAADRGRGRSV